ncbi:MAG: rhomboid family intramembrane serine protease [Flavobacteriaceae bacterium]|nr:rhomboid family intramembrane serine protease [Flavobacteriaceae bacterium]
MIRITDAVKHLIIVNAIFFLATALNQNILYPLLALWFPEHPSFQIWQLISHFFMHGSIGHLFMNMLALFFFGTALEQEWGKQKFLFFYFSAGIGAGLIHLLVNYFYFNAGMEVLIDAGFRKGEILQLLKGGGALQDERWSNVTDIEAVGMMTRAFQVSVVGASGAVYGIMIAYAFLYPNSMIFLMFPPIPIKAKYMVIALIVLDAYSGLTHQNTGTAHFAHLGGALFGFIMAWYWKKNSFNNRRWN